MVVEFQGQRYEYPDSTDIKAFPEGAKVVQGPAGGYHAAPEPPGLWESVKRAIGKPWGLEHDSATAQAKPRLSPSGLMVPTSAEKYYPALQQEDAKSEELRQAHPTATTATEFASALPQAMAFGAAGAGVGGMAKKGIQDQAVNMFGRTLPKQLAPAAEAFLEPAGKTLMQNVIKPAVGGYVGHKAGQAAELMGIPYAGTVGGILGATLGGSGPLHGMASVMTPAARGMSALGYQGSRMLPYLGHAAGFAVPEMQSFKDYLKSKQEEK